MLSKPGLQDHHQLVEVNLFNLPETIGFSVQDSLVDADTIGIAKETILIDHHPVWTKKDLHELLKCYLHIHKSSMPTNADESLEL